MSNHNKIVVVYLPLFGPVQVHARFFKSFVDMLQEPVPGYEVIPFIHNVGPSLDFNRNDAVSRILGGYDPDFIMFVDADNIMPHKVIPRLLAHMDSTEISGVTGLYFKKTFPHAAVPGHFLAWDETLEKKRKSLEAQGLIGPDGQQLLYYRPLRYFDIVRSIDVFGMGCVLLRASVFKHLEQPYFKYLNAYVCQDYTFGTVTEDIYFCGQLKKAGITILCDPTIVSAHLVTKEIVGSEIREDACVA